MSDNKKLPSFSSVEGGPCVLTLSQAGGEKCCTLICRCLQNVLNKACIDG